MRKFNVTLACYTAALFFTACQSNNETTASVSQADRDSTYARLSDEEKRLPKNALAGLDVAPGLEATLFASEPMIGNPTNIDIDARGRVWMCEAFNYRPQLNPENPQREQGDRIVILEDTNGDGKADTSKVFYQGTDVNAALGVTVLGNKVIVSCSPNVFLFTDTNGDDKADTKEILFSHVGGEQHDHAVHAFTFGADGKLYFNFGNAGEQLMDKNGKLVVDKDGVEVTAKGKPYRQGMVFRLNEDGSDLEVLGHNFRNNYEAATDAFGTIWQSDNDDDGNQGTRINYVMEYGNYGFTNEMTGAGWRSKRANMETEIPKRHWHQNDPGSVPNLLFTGAGSPAGLCIYEGSLLPVAFQNGMIHAEAGKNIVRAYPVQNDGAGYKAEIKPLIEGKRDQWFRPIDVSAAPDGSLFVADWYDPGVGGHQMGDMNRGRIYRLAPPDKAYKITQPNLTTPEGAVQALQNANNATRYLAWKQLQSWGAQAEPALQKLWASDNQRMRARALWLLARIPGKEEQYLQAALNDADKDIRITALRAARQLRPDIMPYLQKAVNDKDPQVRREVAIALRHNKNPEAAALWTTLAKHYDGKDRWYLEALGIGADNQWDTFIEAYKKEAGDAINTQSGRDIIWRSRSAMALPLLASNIQNEGTNTADRKKYFRAFDFIESPQKDKILLALLDDNSANSGEIKMLAFNHISPASLAAAPKAKATLEQTLASLKDTQTYVDLAGRYKLTNHNKDLLHIAISMPDSSLGSDAANQLLKAGGGPMIKKAINSNDPKVASAALKTLSRAGTKEAINMMESIIRDGSVALAVRQDAVKLLSTGWGESERLLKMVKEGRLPKQLEPTAALALSNTFRKDIKQEALKYLQVSNASGPALQPINVLAKQSGNVQSGSQMFARTCGTCHKVGGEGANFGPALTQIGSKLTKEALYVAIIHPDAGISFGYEGFVFKMKDGSEVAGIIASETEDAVEVLMPGGIKKRYERSSIVSRKALETSMMPSGLHQTMTQQQLVDLVEYLHAQKGAAQQVVNR